MAHRLSGQPIYQLTITDKSLAWLPGTLTFYAVSAAYYDLSALPNVLPGFGPQHTNLGTLLPAVLPGFSAS